MEGASLIQTTAAIIFFWQLGNVENPMLLRGRVTAPFKGRVAKVGWLVAPDRLVISYVNYTCVSELDHLSC